MQLTALMIEKAINDLDGCDNDYDPLVVARESMNRVSQLRNTGNLKARGLDSAADLINDHQVQGMKPREVKSTVTFKQD